MNQATKLKKFVSRTGADQALYRLSPPFGGKEYVVVSAIYAPFTGPETYIFESDDSGEIVDYVDLEGSYQGGLCHTKALRNIGYEIHENIQDT